MLYHFDTISNRRAVILLMNDGFEKMQVKIKSGVANLCEDLTHIATIYVDGSARTVDSMGNNAEGWGVVLISPKKMLDFFNKDKIKSESDDWWVKPDRLERVHEKLLRGDNVYMPVMYSSSIDDGYMKIIDGRHRTKALYDLGAHKIPVMVPKCQIHFFEEKLG